MEQICNELGITKEEIKKAIETKLNPKFLEMNIKALMATN